MGADYAKAPEVVTSSYAKPAPPADRRKEIQDIARSPYRDAALVLTVWRWREWGAEAGDDEAD
jgi:hypothetical protein